MAVRITMFIVEGLTRINDNTYEIGLVGGLYNERGRGRKDPVPDETLEFLVGGEAEESAETDESGRTPTQKITFTSAAPSITIEIRHHDRPVLCVSKTLTLPKEPQPKTETEADRIRAETQRIQAETGKISAETEKLKAERDKEDATKPKEENPLDPAEKLRLETKLIEAKAGKIGAETEKIKAEAIKAAAEAQMKKEEKERLPAKFVVKPTRVENHIDLYVMVYDEKGQGFPRAKLTIIDNSVVGQQSPPTDEDGEYNYSFNLRPDEEREISIKVAGHGNKFFHRTFRGRRI